MLSLRAGRQVLGACKLVNTPLLRCLLHTSKPTSTFAKDLFLGRFNKVSLSLFKLNMFVFYQKKNFISKKNFEAFTLVVDLSLHRY
jgi:hypothetical protein